MIVTNPFDILNSLVFIDILRLIILIYLVLYAIFTVIIVRQVDLMAQVLITPVSPIVKAFSIIQAGFAIGFVVLVYGLLR